MLIGLVPLFDAHQRPLRSLRLSVTDRCNLRCSYCMPEDQYVWLPRHQLLDFDEASRLVGVFSSLGVDRVRITGGEPLLRRGLPLLVAKLAELPRIADIALTTNGILLARQVRELRSAGLHRLTVSLDTLRPERFKELSRSNRLADVLSGIDAARSSGFEKLKIDAVILRGVNDDELGNLLDYGKRIGAEVRFIEYMDVGGATRWRPEQTVDCHTLLKTIGQRHGPPEPLAERNNAPAQRFRLPDGTTFGIISSNTNPFCGNCNRSRLTADGIWLHCLYATRGIDLKTLLRDGHSDEQLRELISDAWQQRRDRGAEQRHGFGTDRQPLSAETLRQDTHLEMHTRGG